MQHYEVATRSRGAWFRGVLYCTISSPVLAAVLFVLANCLRVPMSELPRLAAVALVSAGMFASVPALLSGTLCTALSMHWREHEISPRSIQLRLSFLGASLGVVSATVALFLFAQEFALDLLARVDTLPLGAVVGFLVARQLPRVLWGPRAA